jgi:DNA-binding MarR family transcriptional regulator
LLIATIANNNDHCRGEKELEKRIIDYIFQLKKKCLIEEGLIGKEVGLLPSEIHCVEALSGGENISGHHLSERMGLSPSRGSRVIDGLIDKGLLVRNVDPEDRRYNLISLTEKGESVRENVEKAKKICEQKITSQMDKNQIELLKNGLKSIIEIL